MKQESERLWNAFMQRIHDRCDKGEKEYGDKSFSADPLTLVREIQDEIADIAGWGFILHARLERIAEQLTRR